MCAGGPGVVGRRADGLGRVARVYQAQRGELVLGEGVCEVVGERVRIPSSHVG
jgi:hypothetical protein